VWRLLVRPAELHDPLKVDVCHMLHRHPEPAVLVVGRRLVPAAGTLDDVVGRYGGGEGLHRIWTVNTRPAHCDKESPAEGCNLGSPHHTGILSEIGWELTSGDRECGGGEAILPPVVSSRSKRFCPITALLEGDLLPHRAEETFGLLLIEGLDDRVDLDVVMANRSVSSSSPGVRPFTVGALRSSVPSSLNDLGAPFAPDSEIVRKHA
jgi:hypothetical protein